ncbi:methyl-accepting chemotaxis protein [Paenibacillus sp.]|uniref:methyl-accepting chemotaxis protein n=1 Tax=Paenibacillus sp. TaxID=58172 RepID=UPI0035684F0D
MKSKSSFKASSLQSLFVPGMFVMNRLRYLYKFILIGSVFFIPIVILMLQLTGEANRNIRFAEQEKQGALFLKPLESLFTDLGQYRLAGLGNTIGTPPTKERLQELEARIERSLEALDRLALQYKDELQATEVVADISASWRELKAVSDGSSPTKTDETHKKLDERFVQLIDTVKVNSNLILDPQLSSYYLMDSITSTYPSLLAKLNQAAAIGMEVSSKTRFSNSAQKDELLLAIGEVDKHQKTLAKSIITAAKTEPALLESLVKELSESENAVVQFNDLLHVQLINNAFIIVEPEKVRTLYEAAVTASENLYAKEMGLLVQQLDQRIAKYHATKTFSLWTVVIVLLFIAYLFFSFTLSLQRSIRQLGEVSQQLGEGRLTVRVPVETKDEFRYVMNAFNALADSFLQVVQEGRHVSRTTLSASEQLHAISTSSTELTNKTSQAFKEVVAGAEVQVQAAQETSTAMNEMSAGVQKIAESSFVVAETAAHAAEQSDKGRLVVEDAIRQMNRIKDNVAGTSVTIRQLAELTLQIDRILKVIRDISEQTRLLSLNASIEAARAGEHGRGFQVVALEVKKLADGSTEAAKQIAGLVAEITRSCRNAVDRTEQDASEVDKGAVAMGNVGTIFAMLVGAVSQVSEQIQEVSAVAEQMSAGTEQVSASMEETVRISRHSTRHLQQVASANEEQLASMHRIFRSAETLQTSSQELQRLLDRFRI